MQELEIKIRPMPKQSVRFTKSGYAYQPKKIVDYQKAIHLYAKSQKIKMLEGAILIEIDSHYQKKNVKSPIPKITRPDVDNLAKPILDALNGVAWKDDSRVCELRLRKFHDSEDKIVIRISEINT